MYKYFMNVCLLFAFFRSDVKASESWQSELVPIVSKSWFVDSEGKKCTCHPILTKLLNKLAVQAYADRTERVQSLLQESLNKQIIGDKIVMAVLTNDTFVALYKNDEGAFFEYKEKRYSSRVSNRFE